MNNDLKDIETSTGKTLEEYTEIGFDRFREDFEAPIAKNHSDMLYRYAAEAADKLGIKISEDDFLRIRDFSDYSDIPEVDFFLRQLVNLEQTGVVQRDKGGKSVSISDKARDPQIREEIKQLADEYLAESSEYFDSSRNYSMHDNPAIDYITEYANLVKRNKLEDAILGRDREGDNDVQSMRREIDAKIGDTVSSKGIEVILEDANDPARAKQLDRFVNELAEIKRASGKTNTSNRTKKLTFDEANDLYKQLEKSDIVHYSEKSDSFYIGNKSMNEFKSDMYEGRMSRSGLDRSDWVVFSLVKEQFGDSGGRVQMPSKELVEGMLRTERSEPRGLDAVTKAEQSGINNLVKDYGDALSRMEKTGLIEKVNSTDTFKDKDINFTEIVNTIKALYAAEAKAEIDDFGKIHSESSKRYNEALKELEVLRSEYEQTGSEKSAQKAQEYVGKYSDVLSRIEDMFGDKKFEQILNQARMMATESAERVDEGEFLNRLFNKDTVDSIARAFDLSRQIANLANIDRAQEGFTPTMARLRSRISEGMRSNVEGIDQMPLEKAFLEYTRDQGYEQSKRLVDELQSSLNRDYNLDTNKMIGDAATKEILDMFRMVSSAEHRGNAQSFVSRLQRLGLNSMLDENNRNLSEDVVNQLKDFDKIKENVISIITDMKANMAFNEYSKHENKIMEEIVSTISTVNRRTSEYNTFSIRGESLVFDNSHSTVMTPLGEFTRNAGFSTTIVKSTSLDIDGNVEHITDLTLNQVQEKIDAAHQRIIKKAVAGEIEDPESLFRMFGRRENISESQHALFVPLQANENVGVLVPRSDENIKLLKSEFNAFTKSIMDEANKRGQSEALGYHLDVMNDLLSKNNSDGISAAVRSMYYYKNISKDMFWQMIGEGKTKGEVYESSRAAQIKSFKYIHHVNSENAMSYDSRTLRMITDAIGVFDTKNVDTKAIAHINKRADEGVNVFVFDDETVDSQGNRIVGTTAYDVIGRTIDAKLDQMDITNSQRAEMRERLIVRTGRDYGMGTDAESLKQSTLDGVTFASEDAMRADALLMGASFDAGVTAAKMQFHDPNNSLIGKTAVRYEPSLAKFMKDNGIDYIIPASSAKSWEGKKDVVKTESWNNQQSIGENISQFSGRIDNISMKNFPAESVKYLYATHGGENVRSNTNTSTMHFINEQGIKDYNKQLNIDQIVGTISRLASNAQSNYFAGGLEGFFKGKYNDSDKHFSHYSAIEQLIDWNIDSQNSLVKDPVMRMLKDSLYNSLLVQKRTDIVNTFLFTDSRLKSPIYDGSDKIGYVKSFGEVRIPDAKRNEGTDANTTIAFTLDRDNDFQDYLLNGEEVSTPNRGADVKYLDDVKDSLKLLWSDVVDQGTYGTSHDRLQEINMALRGQITQDGRPVIYDIDVNKKGEILGRTVSKEITEAVVKLKEAGINDLSLVVNSHKIPKKFAADSIVNRLEGFVDREKGNIIEANNYEVALQHQADQDGDKLVSYMKMPYSVLQSSMYNMALAKDAPTVAPKETSFPNVFGSLTDDRTFTKPNDTASSRTNNPLRYMAAERKSKYIVGTTVKVQGASTLMDLANIKFNGEPIMSFGNTSDADFVKASDFARITGSITQSILDAWKGVHDSLLKQQQIKDYILFGDRGNIPIEAINKTSTGDEGFNGIFNVRYDPNTSRGRVYRDYVREVYNAFEGVYTVFGDTYEGGVATKPEFHHLASTYYRLKGIFSRDNDYLFTRLLAKYNRNNRSADANELRNIFENKDQLEGTRSLKDVFAFDTTFENLIDNHPQLKALHHVVQAGDFSKDTDFAIHRNPLVEEMFGKGDTGAMAKMASVRGDRVFSESLIINDEAVSKLVKSFNQDKFGNIPADAPKKLGLFNHVINNKINQLDYSKNFYKKIGNLEMVEDIKQEIRVLRNQQREVQNKIYKNHIEGVETGKFYDGVDDFNNSLKKDPSKNTPVHIYKVSKTNSGDEYFDFYKVLKPGERLPTYFKGKFVALLNPIEITPTNSKDSIEGMSMELATSDYYYNIEGAVGNKTRADKAVNDARRVVERAKHQLREINSDTFDLTKEMPAIKSEIYDDNSAYSSIVINRMLDDIRKLENDYGIEKVDMLRLALSPRALPNSVVKDSGQLLNNFKIDRKFSLAIIKHINDNKHFKTAEYFPALSKIMESYGDNMMVSKGLTRSSMHAVDNSSISNRRDQYMAIANDKGNSLMQSLTRMAKDDILLRESIKRFDTPRERVNRDGTIDYTAKEARKNNEPDKGCRII